MIHLSPPKNKLQTTNNDRTTKPPPTPLTTTTTKTTTTMSDINFQRIRSELRLIHLDHDFPERLPRAVSLNGKL